MKISIFLFFLHQLAPPILSAEISEVDKCAVALKEKKVPNKNSTKTLAGIVGLGWDDLRNVVTIPIFSTSFKKCNFVPDNDFLLPDGVVAIPIKDIAMDKTSSTFDSFDEYMKESSSKITVSASGTMKGFTASASFSNENQETKKEFFKSNSFMLQNKIIYKAYTLIANQHSGMDEYFIFRLEEIADAIELGKKELAKYKAGKLIFDYGTHVVNKATVGASIEQQVFIESKEKFHGESNMKKMKAEVSGGMANVFSVSGSIEKKTSEASSSSTKNSTTKLIIRTKGGPNIDRLSGVKDKESILFMDNLVGMDQEGLFIHEIVNVAKIKHGDEIRRKLETEIRKATEDYYRFNTIPGCTNASAESFNFMANINDGSCISANKQFGFGGVFQKCNNIYAYTNTQPSVPFAEYCNYYSMKNPVTDDYSCPSEYTKTEIHSFSVTFYNRTIEKKEERSCNWRNFMNCGTIFVNETISEKYHIISYLCQIEKDPPVPVVIQEDCGGSNELDKIMDDNVLKALQEEPGLLKMYFPEAYRAPYNVTHVVISKAGNIVGNAIQDAIGPPPINETETINPEKLPINVCQITKLANFPDVLKQLIPLLNITNGTIETNVEMHGQLVNNPILLKNRIPGYVNRQPPLQPQPESAAKFGGIFSNNHINVFTGTSSCPLNFRQYPFFADLNICIWKDEEEEEWPISFGGFFTCASKDQECPRGFSKYLATDFDNCAIYYCVRMINRKTFETPVINRPPFNSVDIHLEKYKSNLS